MKRKNALLIFIILFVTGCGGFASLIQPKFIQYNGSKQAVASAYHLSKKPFVFSELIDTSAIYRTSEILTISDRHGKVLYRDLTYYSYLRFNAKGVVFKSSRMLEYPTDEIANSMDRGQYCFYVVKDSIVKIEIYNWDTRVFEYWFGKIQANGDIQFYRRKGRPWGTYRGKLEYTYKKFPAKLTKPIVFPTEEWENEWYYSMVYQLNPNSILSNTSQTALASPTNISTTPPGARASHKLSTVKWLMIWRSVC